MWDDPWEDPGDDLLDRFFGLLLLLAIILAMIDVVVRKVTEVLMNVKAMLDSLMAVLLSTVAVLLMVLFFYVIPIIAVLATSAKLGVWLYRNSDRAGRLLSSAARRVAGFARYWSVEPFLAIRDLNDRLERRSGDLSCLIVLRELLRGPAGSLRELGERVGERTLSTVYSHVKHLEDDGLVEREVKSRHGRRGSPVEVRISLARRFDRWLVKFYLKRRIGRLLKGG